MRGLGWAMFVRVGALGSHEEASKEIGTNQATQDAITASGPCYCCLLRGSHWM